MRAASFTARDGGRVQQIKDAEGVPFTEAAVTRMLETEPMASLDAACLALAWQHRGVHDL